MIKWCARHPRLLLLVVLAVDVAAARRVHLMSIGTSEPGMAAYTELCLCSLVFGTLCVLFPNILGGMEGPAGHGAWLKPTPGSLVTFIGWVLMGVPPLVLACLVLF